MVARSDEIELDGELAELSSTTIAVPEHPIAAVRNSTTAVPGAGPAKKRIVEDAAVAVSSEFLTTATQVGKVVAAAVKPVPWLGEAVGLVASIVELCQNVGKNKQAAAGLADHCRKLLDVAVKHFSESSESSANGILQELIDLLRKIKVKLEKWTKLNPVVAFFKQGIISDGIKKFREEIDQFCQRYSVFAQSLLVNWTEDHERRWKVDVEGIKVFLSDLRSGSQLEAMSRKEEISKFSGDFQKFLSFFQGLLLQSAPHSTERITLEQNFSIMCRTSGEIPPEVELTEGLLKMPRDPVPGTGTGTFDIYQGVCIAYTEHVCAIKVLRRLQYGRRTKERFERQLKHWRSVYARDGGKHILPLIGAVFRISPSPFLCFVSPWMENRDALRYVKNCTNDVDRIKLIRSIAEGVKVLHTHEPPLVHCFLKSSNILINDIGEPLLGNFGLMRIIEQEMFHSDSSPDTMAAFRYLAPEMIPGVGCTGEHTLQPTAKVDIFMFAMTVLELMTEKRPYAHIKRDPEVLIYRSRGGRPLRPTDEEDRELRERGLDDQLWALLEHCWSDNPNNRPTIIEVINVLECLPSPRI